MNDLLSYFISLQQQQQQLLFEYVALWVCGLDSGLFYHQTNKHPG